MNPQKKILVVDDEVINLEFFEVMLSKLGFIVEKATDGVEALEKVKRFRPDLIMLDNIMPRMSGWELTKTLKANPKFREIAIIMFSALDDVKDKVESFELGIDDYITKPFNFSEVLARIRVVLRNREFLEQMVARESRLNQVETLSAAMKDNMADFIKSLDELDSALTDPTHDEIRLSHLRKNVRQHIADMEVCIKKTIAEWESFKQNEIGLAALEHQFHSDPHQE